MSISTEPSTTSGAQVGAVPWSLIRWVGGGAVLAVVIWRLGTGPVLAGLESIDLRTLSLALGIGVLTTFCSAWRWSLVARGLGIPLSLRTAVAACYRAQFLNTTLPGGVLGDVHRGVRHGREADDVGRGLRAVGWERAAGQVVFVGLALLTLLGLPSPVQGWIPVACVALVAVVVIVWLVMSRWTGADGGRWARVVSSAADDLRAGLGPRTVWPKVLLTSVVVAVGHAATFVIAARATGTTAATVDMLPIAVLVLLAMVVPLNVGGWGPREGMAAWAFAAAGLGAAQGFSAATAYGVMAMVATLPGALVLLTDVAGARARRVATTAISAKVGAGAPLAESEKDAAGG